jgi:hypothetical protein
MHIVWLWLRFNMLPISYEVGRQAVKRVVWNAENTKVQSIDRV